MISKKPSNTFKTLNNKILQALSKLNFHNWTPVQECVIPYLLKNVSDTIVMSQTGTGKTAAYGIPILNTLSNNNINVYPSAVIIAPTHELCLQITSNLQSYAKYLKHISITPIYGGADITSQIKNLKKGSDIIVATPGRFLDIIRRKAIKTNNISTLVIDEADKMFNMGFIDEIDEILNITPKNKKTWLFSATIPEELKSVIYKYVNKPKTFTIGIANSQAKNIDNDYYVVENENKMEALKRIINFYPEIYAFIFCKTKITADKVTSELIKTNFPAGAIHGDLTQAQRDEVMEKFRNRNIKLLIATDIAARGIDVDNLTHVINYNIPDDPEQYIHRSGRTGRINKRGTSITILNVKEQFKLQNIANARNIKFNKRNIPNNSDIINRNLEYLTESLCNIEDTNIGKLQSLISQDMISSFQNISKEEIVKRIICLEINRLSLHLKNNKDINIKNLEEITNQELQEMKHSDEQIRKAIETSENGMVRISINIGHETGTVPARIIGLINDTVRHKIKIGKIEIFHNYSTVEVEADFLSMLIDSFDNREDKRYKIEIL